MCATIIRRIEELPSPPPKGTYVVIDVYRFSTTVAQLLDAGVEEVHTFGDPEEARAFKRERGAILFGERGGQRLAGFDHNNSPTAVQAADFTETTVGICTTNGTRALESLGEVGTVLIGSTVNAASTARVLESLDSDVYLLACGADGEVADEDLVGAEMIAEYYEDARLGEPSTYRRRLVESNHATELAQLGFAEDVELALEFDSLQVVPTLNDDRVITPRVP